jgi:hypothetical protein
LTTRHQPGTANDSATEAAVTPEQPSDLVDGPRPDAMLRVVGGSIAAGLLGVLVLTLGVFGGAPEHVISGSALLAFAGAGPYLLS